MYQCCVGWFCKAGCFVHLKKGLILAVLPDSLSNSPQHRAGFRSSNEVVSPEQVDTATVAPCLGHLRALLPFSGRGGQSPADRTFQSPTVALAILGCLNPYGHYCSWAQVGAPKHWRTQSWLKIVRTAALCTQCQGKFSYPCVCHS